MNDLLEQQEQFSKQWDELRNALIAKLMLPKNRHYALSGKITLEILQALGVFELRDSFCPKASNWDCGYVLNEAFCDVSSILKKDSKHDSK